MIGILTRLADQCVVAYDSGVDALNPWHWPRWQRRAYVLLFPIALPLHAIAAVLCGLVLVLGLIFGALEQIALFWSAP